MTKKKLNIERELKSKSAKIIWPLLSTPEGLAKWVADTVKKDNNVFTFTWGDVSKNHDMRSALLLEKKDYEYIRFRWDRDEAEDTYLELRIEKGEITDDYVLIITDFAFDGDTDALEDIWDANLYKLNRSTGL